ncbi:hypothetical protein YC2023_036877 [Brassica napus]
MEDSPDISWGCNIDSVENATSLQRWLTNSGFPPKKMAVDSVDIREREECAQLTSQCAHLQDRTMALAKELASLKLVSDISLEEVDVLKLAFFENNAKDKRYNRHTRFFGNLRSIVVCVELVFWLSGTIDEVPTTTTVTNLQKFMLLKFNHLQALANFL